jgi:hypothetical protein
MRTFRIATTSAAALFASSAFTQERSQGTESLADFSGIWGNPYLYGVEPPLSGPGPTPTYAGYSIVGHRVQVNTEAGRGFGADIAGPTRLVCAVA